MGRLFGTDGVRGQANTYPMDAVTALAIGHAVAAYYKPESGRAHIALGWDTRVSCDMLAHAVAAGICATGVDVELLGVLPTPGIARIAVAQNAAAGIVISASHNPYSDNGIKVFGPDGLKPTVQDEEDIEALASGSRLVTKALPDQVGRVRTFSGAAKQYRQFLQSVSQCSLNGLTVVLDCANGATFDIAPTLFEALGAKVIALFCSPDGFNINDHCGSQHPDQLAAAVIAHQADIGLAFDGDGDRLIAVDNTGKTLSGDHIIAICAAGMFEKGALRNGIVVTTVMSNLGFHHAMQQMGIELVTTQVGDRQVVEKMLQKNAVLGGEDSGHIIFRNAHTTGDGMLAGIKLIEAMLASGKPLSILASEIMTVFPQALINVDIRHKTDLATIPEIVDTIDEAERLLGDHGRVLVRYSGTQNICRVMTEGPNQAVTENTCRYIADAIKRTIGA